MARARNLKPGLFKNELLGVADPFLTLLFESLWCLADRDGRLEDRPLRIKAETFPYREGLDVNVYLTELERMGFIHRYVVAEMPLIQIVNFLKHQNPHKTEKASDLPERPIKSNGCALTVKEPLKNGSHPADSLLLIPDSLLLIPDSLSTDSGLSDSPIPDSGIQKNQNVEQKPLDLSAAPVPVADPIPEIFAYWQKVMKSPRSVLDDKRRSVIKKALKNYSPADICIAIRGCSKSPYHMGDNESKTVYNTLGLILRSADYIDKFMDIDQKPVTRQLNGQERLEQENARIAEEWARKMNMVEDDDAEE